MSSDWVIETDGSNLILEQNGTEIVIDGGASTMVLAAGGAGVGPAGPAGPAGAGFSYVHTQAVASTLWTIVHNLAGYPNVTTLDGSGVVLFGTVDYVNANTIHVTHSSAYSGQAFLS